MSLSKAWETIQEMLNAFVAALPNIGLAIIVFAVFYLGAKWIGSMVERVVGATGLSRSAGLVLGLLRVCRSICGLTVRVTSAARTAYSRLESRERQLATPPHRRGTVAARGHGR